MTDTARRLRAAQNPPVRAIASASSLSARSRGMYERYLKPVLDWILGLVLAVMTLPVVLVVLALVAVDVGRPVFLRQERVGLGGETFRVWKFRTMHHDRRNGGNDYIGDERRINHKSKDDPRLTPIGRFLRRWSLDELPQLWNVVAGQMSIVGPRRELVQIVDRYQPWQHARHLVKPGITGLWQVSARGEVPMHEATHIDVEYIEDLSFGNDLRILLKTIPAALGRRQGH